MKAMIIRHDVSRVENGVRKHYGDIVEITEDELKTGAYAPLKVNVRPRAKKDVKRKSNVEDTTDNEPISERTES